VDTVAVRKTHARWKSCKPHNRKPIFTEIRFCDELKRWKPGPRFGVIAYAADPAGPRQFGRQPHGDKQAGGRRRSREQLPQNSPLTDSGGSSSPDTAPPLLTFRGRSATASSPIAQSAVTKPLRRAEGCFKGSDLTLSVLPLKTLPDAAQADSATHSLGETLHVRR
jgi:hypothetical protein